MKRHENVRKIEAAEGRFNYSRFCEDNSTFNSLLGVVSPFALKKVAQHLKHIAPDMVPCTGIFTKISGLPCKHLLSQRIANGEELKAEDFDNHWRYPLTSAKQTIWRYKNPEAVRNKKRNRNPNVPKNSTLRDTIAVEEEDGRLSQLQRDEQRQARAAVKQAASKTRAVNNPTGGTQTKRARPTKVTAADRPATASAGASAKSDAETAESADERGIEPIGRGKRVKVVTSKMRKIREIQAVKDAKKQAKIKGKEQAK